jgi:hypothetical protein
VNLVVVDVGVAHHKAMAQSADQTFEIGIIVNERP